MTSKREVSRLLERLENEDGGDDVPDIVLRDTVVSTPWSDAGDTGDTTETCLTWQGGEWVEENP